MFPRAGWKPAIPGLLAFLLLAAPAFAGDAVKGKAGFARCAACHRVGEGAKNVVGPQLNGIVGRPAATAPDYAYSQAMKASGKIWDEASLRLFLTRPSAAVPGTKMTFAGVREAATVDDIIAYLATFDADGRVKP
ncbi:cytochrome c family protein [Labrys sp. LIt4]|uniref:Cytochrome c family protein n=1 Tax=Labrys okinawensis TaxID=346911 RepID=A0A2S9QEC6_9HYPH|nr:MULTISPECIES: cytochrome c family protein [Labrys]MBP0577921.1 cytochrome c family protein [Labrys sp. LIt4]PRH87708.1 cytochrome c family protein [Labrys okinawensis]